MALLLPTGISIAFITTPFVYALLNHLSAPSCDSMDTLWDESSNLLPLEENNKCKNHDDIDSNIKTKDHLSPSTLTCIPAIHDIDVSIINQSISRQFIKQENNENN